MPRIRQEFGWDGEINESFLMGQNCRSTADPELFFKVKLIPTSLEHNYRHVSTTLANNARTIQVSTIA